MGLIDFFIQNPVKVMVGVILTVLFGALAYLGTPVQLTPEVIEPQITVTTRWPGASPQEVEREIVDEQEEQLKSVEGLIEFKSESRDSEGMITLKFAAGTDMPQAQVKVNNKLNQVKEYPANADEPVISEVNSNDQPIAWFILKPLAPTRGDVEAFIRRNPKSEPLLAPLLEDDAPIDMVVLNRISRDHPEIQPLAAGRVNPSHVRRYAEDYIEARFEQITGVANANTIGGQLEEMRVVIDPARLAAHKLTIADLRRALIAENKDTSGGDIWEGKSRVVIRTVNQYRSPEQIGETIVAIRDGGPVRVRDLARVELNYRKPDGIVRQQGVEGLAVNAQLKPGSNVLEVMGPPVSELDVDGDGAVSALDLTQAKVIYGDNLRIATTELNLELAARGLIMEQVYDQTEYIHAATDLVEGNIYVGGTLAVLVLLAFLRSWRSVLIIGLAIPISVIGTFLFVRAFGRTVNVISLAGMAFAVGMVVDNAVVVLENIYRHYHEGERPLLAATNATREVWGAVLASTLTTLAVFIPVIFLEGQAGQLFRDISIALACAVGLSMIVSITVIPTAAARILSERRPQRAKQGEEVSRMFGLLGLFQGMVQGFGRMLRAILSERVEGEHRPIFSLKAFGRLAIVLAFFGVSAWATWQFFPKTEYLPEGNRNLVIAVLLPPPGYNLDKMIEIGKDIERDLDKYWLPPEKGQPVPKGPRIKNFFFVARGRMLFMGARAEDELKAGELIPILQRTAGSIPGMIPIVSQVSLFDSAFSGGRTIDIEITGPDLERLVVLGGRVMQDSMRILPPTEGNQIRPIPSLDLSSPEVHIVPRLERAADLGVTATDLGYAIDALADGAYVGDYIHNGRKIDLVIYGADDYLRHTQDLAHLPISTPSGELVPVNAVADVKVTSGPEQVNHSQRLRTIAIQVKPQPLLALETAMELIETEIRQPLLEEADFGSGGYRIRMAGTADKLNETRRAMQWNLLLAAAITYLLMSALFESFFYPTVIMTSVALGMVGGVAGLAILNLFTPQALDTLTMLGFIILIGTVVNNPILIVHQSLVHMRDEGMNETDAIVAASTNRIRPIMMTTVTTVLGMLPLVLPGPTFPDGFGAWWQGTGRLELAVGAGSELYRGLGAVILGGLILSTAFTLILTPVGFSLALDIKRGVMRFLGYHSSEDQKPPTHRTHPELVPDREHALGS